MRHSNHLPLLVTLLLVLGLGVILACRRDREAGSRAPLFTVVDQAGIEPAAPARLSTRPDKARASVEPRADATRWIEGRVALPPGSLPDASLCVVALGAALPDAAGTEAELARSWERHALLARTGVAPDGSFRLALPSTDFAQVQLDLDGRFLFLQAPLPVAEGGNHVVLEPQLGGALRGKLLLPPGADQRPALVHVGTYGMDYQGSSQSRAVTLEGGLDFELRALQPDLRYTLWAMSDRHPGARASREVRVQAGESAEANLTLTRGARVRGVVQDASAAPIAGVEVRADAGAMYSLPLTAGQTYTDAEGRFELRGLVARPQTLSARLDGYLEGRSTELDLQEGGAEEDLVIVLDEGLVLAGVLRMPDGSPAEDARISLVPFDPSHAWELIERSRSSAGAARSAPDGTFRIESLHPGEYSLYASREGPEGVALSARATGLAAGDPDLDLSLSPCVTYAGRVVDDAGAPVDAFEVEARRADWPRWMEGPSAEVSARFDGAAGRFDLSTLDAGTWEVSIEAAGHLWSGQREVVVPAVDGEPFVLTRTARLSGTVLDPNGEPVVGAEVRASLDSQGGRSAVTETDAQGRFELDSVGPGALSLEASSDDWAPSRSGHLDSEPGSEHRDWTLHLTRGGAVGGVVFDSAGVPDVGRSIGVQSQFGDVREAFSDDSGSFLVEHLAPGVYQVIAMPDEAVWASADPESQDLGAMWNELRMAMATVVDGETAQVVLGAPPRAPVVVHGRITRGGDPVSGAGLFALAEGGRMLETLRADSADALGYFELELDEPGDYTFVILGSDQVEREADFPVTIPAVERQRLDLALPAGSIRGRVNAPDGGPAEQGMVWARREDGTSELSALMAPIGVSLEADGRFAIEGLHPGHYTLSASAGSGAWATRHGVLVAQDRATEGIGLSLVPTGRLVGTLVDAQGAGVEDAVVHLRDGDGRPLYRLSGQSDHRGAFEIEGVPIGEVLVSARTSQGVSPSALAVVTPEGEARVSLELGPGVLLRVVLADADGLPLRASVRVQDGAGHDHAGCTTRDELEDFATHGLTQRERRVGPVPPGPYRVQARSADGRSAELDIVLDGLTGERRIELRLAD